MNPQPETYTTAQAAARTGLTSAAIRNLIDAGQFPRAYKQRGLWRIPPTDLKTRLQNHTRPSMMKSMPQ